MRSVSLYTWISVIAACAFLWWVLPIVYRLVMYSPLERCRQARQRGDLPQAKEWAEFAIESARDDMERSFALEELGGIHRFQGDNGAAIDCYRQALNLREQNRSPGDPDVAAAQGNLGMALLANGQFCEAEQLLRKSCESVRTNPVVDEQLLAHLLMNLGQACVYAGKLDESAPLLDEGVALTRQEFGDLHDRTAEALLNLGTSASVSGQYERANRAYQESRACFTNLYGEQHVKVLVNLQLHAQVHLAWFRLKGNQYALAEADQLATTMVAGLREMFGASHYFTAIGLAVQSRVRCLQQRPNEALQLATEALEIGQATIAADHLPVSYCHMVVAHALDDLNRIPEAWEQASAAQAIVEKCLGRDHYENGGSLELFGRLAHREGRDEEAERLLLRSLAVREPLGLQHPVRAFALRELAPVLESLGRRDEAAACRREEQAIVAAR